VLSSIQKPKITRLLSRAQIGADYRYKYLSRESVANLRLFPVLRRFWEVLVLRPGQNGEISPSSDQPVAIASTHQRNGLVGRIEISVLPNKKRHSSVKRKCLNATTTLQSEEIILTSGALPLFEVEHPPAIFPFESYFTPSQRNLRVGVEWTDVRPSGW
jgi:hypothetical protein